MLEKKSLITMIIVVVFFLLGIVWLYFTKRSIYFQKRIGNHAISNPSLENLSLLDQISSSYQKTKQNMIEKIGMTNRFKEYVLFKQKELEFSIFLENLIDKILCSISLMVIYIFLSILSIIPFKMILLLLAGIIGFSLLSLITSIKNKIERKQIEKDLLKAVSLMNNAFQSGKSIIQAIQTVALELDGPLSSEFTKIYQDMLHGLSFETAFIRFQKRVKLEEIGYITASLSILNKTGGNITKVFTSIENNFYTRRKLEMELKAIIASSRLVFQFLIFLPILLWVVIGVMNNSYFTIFFQSTLGMLLFLIIVSIYFIYIILIINIMKVEKY